MKQGIIYGGTFLFAFVIVTGMIIYFNSSYENIFQFDFSNKSTVQLSDSTKTDSTKTDSLNVAEKNEITSLADSIIVQDSVLLSSLGGVEANDSVNADKNLNKIDKIQPENLNKKKEIDTSVPKNIKTNVAENQQTNIKPLTQNVVQGKEYTEWVQKVTSIYSALEPKKAAKIIQTYSDNVARDILYNMSKKTAAKVVSELSPETANRIFRFE
jgi:flagellar motility protein MotE (MotC chaperone)